MNSGCMAPDIYQMYHSDFLSTLSPEVGRYVPCGWRLNLVQVTQKRRPPCHFERIDILVHQDYFTTVQEGC